jgi:carbon-monoxide dehydrogenase iron sulfur subunit
MEAPHLRRIHADPSLCRDCQACTLACSLYHEGACHPSLARLAVTKDMAAYAFHITICQHCDPPACMAACPADAMWMDGRGVVLIDDEACIRCEACASSCPHGAISYHTAEDRYLKCDLCAGREGGPLCVVLCPVGALTLHEGGGAE